MKVSFKRKVILHFPTFMIISLIALVLSYYSHYILNQKLQIIEKKDMLFNIILEARRYEKNYFLDLNREHIEKALSYASRAQGLLNEVTTKYGRYTRTKNLEDIVADLLGYERSLAALLNLREKDGAINVDTDTVEKFQAYKTAVQQQGRRITTEFENIIIKERKFVQGLIGKSKIYHTIALAAIFLLSILTTLFLIIKVNRPLKSIEDAVFKIARGQFTNIPTLSTGDEFESLVNSLNLMINELNARNVQILQNEKLASLGTLTSGVAHELNNPLNNISTSVQILLEEMEDDFPEFKKDLLVETEKQVERARDTVKSLLEFSREKSFSPEPVNFHELVEQTLKLTKAEIPASIQLNIDVPENIQIRIDPQRIQQVLINLIINAVHAMEKGGVLSITAFMQKDGNTFCFQVQDTGIGISGENLKKIFDPFFTTKDIGVGTGLGLSTSHGIVEQHGGKIEVISEPGKGTTFTVVLPVTGDEI